MTNRLATSTSRHAAIFGIFIVFFACSSSPDFKRKDTNSSEMKSCMWQHTATLPDTSRQLLNAISFKRCQSFCPQEMIWIDLICFSPPFTQLTPSAFQSESLFCTEFQCSRKLQEANVWGKQIQCETPLADTKRGDESCNIEMEWLVST